MPTDEHPTPWTVSNRQSGWPTTWAALVDANGKRVVKCDSPSIAKRLLRAVNAQTANAKRMELWEGLVGLVRAEHTRVFDLGQRLIELESPSGYREHLANLLARIDAIENPKPEEKNAHEDR